MLDRERISLGVPSVRFCLSLREKATTAGVEGGNAGSSRRSAKTTNISLCSFVFLASGGCCVGSERL